MSKLLLEHDFCGELFFLSKNGNIIYVVAAGPYTLFIESIDVI